MVKSAAIAFDSDLGTVCSFPTTNFRLIRSDIPSTSSPLQYFVSMFTLLAPSPLGLCLLQTFVVSTDTSLLSVSGLIHLLVLRFLLLVMHLCVHFAALGNRMSSVSLPHKASLLRSSKSRSTVSEILSPISFVSVLACDDNTTPDHPFNLQAVLCPSIECTRSDPPDSSRLRTCG